MELDSKAVFKERALLFGLESVYAEMEKRGWITMGGLRFLVFGAPRVGSGGGPLLRGGGGTAGGEQQGEPVAAGAEEAVLRSMDVLVGGPEAQAGTTR